MQTPTRTSDKTISGFHALQSRFDSGFELLRLKSYVCELCEYLGSRSQNCLPPQNSKEAGLVYAVKVAGSTTVSICRSLSSWSST